MQLDNIANRGSNRVSGGQSLNQPSDSDELIDPWGTSPESIAFRKELLDGGDKRPDCPILKANAGVCGKQGCPFGHRPEARRSKTPV